MCADKIEKRWCELTRSGGSLVVVDLERSGGGLGISLAGHRDRMKMAVFICGINPAGQAHRTKMLEVGDEVSLGLLVLVSAYLKTPSYLFHVCFSWAGYCYAAGRKLMSCVSLPSGPQILEVNGNVVYQRCHLNASALIKGLPHSHVKIVALR